MAIGTWFRRGFAPGIVNNKKGCTRFAAASDKVYQLLAHGRWFCPGTPASSTTKTGCHDIAEILLKVALNTIRSINQLEPGHKITFCVWLIYIYIICVFCHCMRPSIPFIHICYRLVFEQMHSCDIPSGTLKSVEIFKTEEIASNHTFIQTIYFGIA